MLEAVIFDMDGTVLDTEHLNFKATKKLFKEYNHNIKWKDASKGLGRGAKLYVKNLLKKYKIKENLSLLLKKRKDYYFELAKKELRVFPGILYLIKELRKNKIKVALATSASLKTIKENFKIVKLNTKIFDIITTKEKIKNFKPNPEEFIKTMKKLKVKPSECVIIEDSISGVEAGKRAGTKVIAVTNSFPKTKLRKADLVVNSATELNIKILKNLKEKH